MRRRGDEIQDVYGFSVLSDMGGPGCLSIDGQLCLLFRSGLDRSPHDSGEASGSDAGEKA